MNVSIISVDVPKSRKQMPHFVTESIIHVPAHDILLLIALANNEGSGQSVHKRRLARTFAARIHYAFNVDEDSEQNLDLQFRWISQRVRSLEAFAYNVSAIKYQNLMCTVYWYISIDCHPISCS